MAPDEAYACPRYQQKSGAGWGWGKRFVKQHARIFVSLLGSEGSVRLILAFSTQKLLFRGPVAFHRKVCETAQ
jgi:hypothetical protein